jgi:hypothetical protein
MQLPGPPPGPPPRHAAGGDAPGAPPHRNRRRGLLAALTALVLVIAGVGGWLIWHNSQSSHSASGGSHMPGTAMPHMPNAVMHSPLMKALTLASKATSKLPLNKCHPHSTTFVTCTQPNFAVQTVTFRTYPSLTALYKAYVADVRSLGNTQGSSIKTNFADCNTNTPYGEVSWNHDHHHLRTYSLAQSIGGMLNPSSQAAGRVFCTIGTTDGLYHIVWTEGAGRLLGTLVGDPHDSAFLWWLVIHHNIDLTGTGMHMGM